MLSFALKLGALHTVDLTPFQGRGGLIQLLHYEQSRAPLCPGRVRNELIWCLWYRLLSSLPPTSLQVLTALRVSAPSLHLISMLWRLVGVLRHCVSALQRYAGGFKSCWLQHLF